MSAYTAAVARLELALIVIAEPVAQAFKLDPTSPSELARKVAVQAAPEALDADEWARLAESREGTNPSDALQVYLGIADDILGETDRRAYSRAVRLLKRARSAAEAAGERHVFDSRVSGWREQYRRRPTMIAMFDKAGL